MTTSVRERNRRGEGAKLRDEILAAATALLEETGNEEAVTLRAVARGVGISAPSIYAHFPDREAIVDAVVDDAFSEFAAALQHASDAAADTVDRLRGLCTAYLDFAERQPNRYRLLFGRRNLAGDRAGRPFAKIRTDGFDLLVDALRGCVEAGRSTSADPFGDATAIWVALHGYAVLHAGLPAFPWPAGTATVDRIVDGLAQLTDA